MDTLKTHFDELLLAGLIIFLVIVYFYRPDAAKWVEIILGALLLALRNNGKNSQGGNGNGQAK